MTGDPPIRLLACDKLAQYPHFKKHVLPWMKHAVNGVEVVQLVHALWSGALQVALEGGLPPTQTAPLRHETWFLESTQTTYARRSIDLFGSSRLCAYGWICSGAMMRGGPRAPWFCSTNGAAPCETGIDGRPTEPVLRSIDRPTYGGRHNEHVLRAEVRWKAARFPSDTDAKNWAAKPPLDYDAYVVNVGRPQALDHFQPFFTRFVTRFEDWWYLKVYIDIPGGSERVQVTLDHQQRQALKKMAGLSGSDDARLLNGYPDLTRQFAESHRVLGPIGQWPEFRFVGLERATCACRCLPFAAAEDARSARRVGP